MTLSSAAREVILGLADDELMMGHRHSEWLGQAPFLEEDLAFASIAQDELGHARALYGLLTDDLDALAFGRAPEEYRSSWLVELPASEWEDALVRHVLYDLAERSRWTAMLGSTVPGLEDVARKAMREEAYHLRHSLPLVTRMIIGTDQSRARVVGALDRLYPVARGLFEPSLGEAEAIDEGVFWVAADAQAADWTRELTEVFAGVDLDWNQPATGLGGRRGERSEHFGELFANMTAVLALDPKARW